jgi:hypothetical protein
MKLETKQKLIVDNPKAEIQLKQSQIHSLNKLRINLALIIIDAFSHKFSILTKFERKKRELGKLEALYIIDN